jgi:predicted 3-demethylubiquinone-9 3-methyltransferase (glyoxalase superfamily)
MAKNTIRLGYDKNAEAAAHFHAETFPDSAVRAVRRAPSTTRSSGVRFSPLLAVHFWAASRQALELLHY